MLFDDEFAVDPGSFKGVKTVANWIRKRYLSSAMRLLIHVKSALKNAELIALESDELSQFSLAVLQFDRARSTIWLTHMKITLQDHPVYFLYIPFPLLQPIKHFTYKVTLFIKM